MLHDLTPDESLTGGAWYSDQDFESEFVEVLSQHCLKFLQQKVGHTSLSGTVLVDLCLNLRQVGVRHC